MAATSSAPKPARPPAPVPLPVPKVGAASSPLVAAAVAAGPPRLDLARAMVGRIPERLQEDLDHYIEGLRKSGLK